MRIHLIAVGGAVMHNIAIALHKMGHVVSGSDDEIFDPAKTRLASYNLLPESYGWHPEIITPDIDVVILGMHARKDNPELLRAMELGLKINSFPEYFYEMSKNKKRVVIGGSHGKTTITAMVLHVLNEMAYDFDYLVGAQIVGFDTMVRITSHAPYLIAEGDEYLSSAIDLRPKFHLYMPHIAVLSGIAWDHINVFPEFDGYVEQFKIFINKIEPNGVLFYCKHDDLLCKVVEESRSDIRKIPYGIPEYRIQNGKTIVSRANYELPLSVFGEHNLMNMEAASCICTEMGISQENFDKSISRFKGAARRLELIAEDENTAVYNDFAHSPSKLKATVDAVKKQYPDRRVIALAELHTFSSLSESFLDEYKGSMNIADARAVYFNPHAIALKKLKPITAEQIQIAFGDNNLQVFSESGQIPHFLKTSKDIKTVYILMSSGNFDNLNIKELAENCLNY